MTAVYDAWCGLKDVHAALIARTAARYGLTADRVLRSSLLCIALHDVGKLTRNFRGMMLADGEAAYREAVKRNYRHEVASLWLVTRAARDMNKKGTPFPGDGLLETLAVAGHHKYLADGFLLDGDKFRDKELTWDPDLQTALNAAYGLARLMFQEQGWKTPQLRVTPEELTIWLEHSPGVTLNGPFDWLIKCVEDLPRDGVRYRDLFMLLKGLLMTADWMASGAVGRDEDLDAAKGIVRVAPGLLEGHLRDRVESRINDRRDLGLKPFTGYKPFQVACGEANGHVIAIAPTGSGKTEASWLWALRQVERGHARKIIVLLPTMVTANSIHQRLRRFFKKQGHEVGLVHSTSDLVRASEAADEADRADVRADHLSETHFFRPVTVGTVDQLLVSLFHAGRWAMKTTAAADAAIVIDEIHAYEPHTLGLITLMIEQLVALGARFMIMSATMPDALKRTLRDVLTSRGSDDPGVNLVEEPTLLDSARNMWQTSVTSLSEWLFQGDDRGRKIPSAELLDLWKWRNDRGEPNRILIVVNTVKRCQDLAKALREFGFDLVCYHSKFIFDDRRKKER